MGNSIYLVLTTGLTDVWRRRTEARMTKQVSVSARHCHSPSGGFEVAAVSWVQRARWGRGDLGRDVERIQTSPLESAQPTIDRESGACKTGSVIPYRHTRPDMSCSLLVARCVLAGTL
jgi:hypothetical protein